MAMIKCRECGKEVSSKAAKCPHCGVSTPAVGNKEALLGCLFIVVLIGGCSAWVSYRASEDPEQKRLQAERALSDEECSKDLRCWGERHAINAHGPCVAAVEKLANYTSRWVDGTLEMKFPRFRFGSKENKTVIYTGDAIEFQNGFGAFQRHVYFCEYNPLTGTVVKAIANPGRLTERPAE